jgi:hypothetical protein
VTPSGQLLVEIVEHEIAQEGRERAPLRGPLVHRADQAVFHHSGLEKRPDELEHPFIGHPRGDARHQAVMIDPVEKFFEIKVNHNAVALGNVSLRLGHRLMGGASRSEAVTVPRKRRVPSLLENLQHGLLDQSVDDARHAELSDPAVRLGDFDPLDRLRLVGSREQLRPDVWPVLTQVGLGALDGHSIGARATSVTANSFPRSYEISSVAHLLHQLFCAGRAFGCGLCHGWFGPLVSAARGFTPSFWDQGQRVLDLLPRSTHELPVLLAALNRSGLRSSFPARPICCSAFQPWSASLTLPTAGPSMPSLMDMDFATSCPLVRRWRLISGFCSSARTFAPRFLQTPPRGDSPCASLTLHLHQIG